MSNRRLVLLVTSAALAAAALPADAAPPRSFGTDYTGAGVAGASQLYFGTRCGAQCVSFTVARGERRVRVTVSDSTGRPVGWIATVGTSVGARGCGTAVVPARAGQTWWVQTALLDTCPGVPTRGRLVAQLLR